MKKLLLLLTIAAGSAFGADITGTWKGTAESPNGTIERTFVFKVDGAKLTGETVSEMIGKSTLEEGKVDGDNLSFTITAKFQGDEMKLKYQGKVTGNEMKLHVESADGGFSIDYNAKKVQ